MLLEMPVCRAARLTLQWVGGLGIGLQHPVDRLRHLFIATAAWARRPQLVMQTGDFFAVALAPGADGGRSAYCAALRDDPVGQPAPKSNKSGGQSYSYWRQERVSGRLNSRDGSCRRTTCTTIRWSGLLQSTASMASCI